jgi:hypothetical protein
MPQTYTGFLAWRERRKFEGYIEIKRRGKLGGNFKKG